MTAYNQKSHYHLTFISTGTRLEVVLSDSNWDLIFITVFSNNMNSDWFIVGPQHTWKSMSITCFPENSKFSQGPESYNEKNLNFHFDAQYLSYTSNAVCTCSILYVLYHRPSPLKSQGRHGVYTKCTATVIVHKVDSRARISGFASDVSN